MKNIKKISLCMFLFACSSLFYSIKASAISCSYRYSRSKYDTELWNKSNNKFEDTNYARFMKFGGGGYAGISGPGNFGLYEQYLLKAGDHPTDKQIWEFGIDITVSNGSINTAEYVSKYMDGSETRKTISNYGNVKIKNSSCPTVITGNFREDYNYILGIQNGTSVKIELQEAYYIDDYPDVSDMIGDISSSTNQSITLDIQNRLDWALTFWQEPRIMINYTNLREYYDSSNYKSVETIFDDYRLKGVNFDTLYNAFTNENCVSQDSCYSQLIEELKKIMPCNGEKADTSELLKLSQNSFYFPPNYYDESNKYYMNFPVKVLDQFDNDNIVKYVYALSYFLNDSWAESYSSTVCKVASDDKIEKNILSRCDSASNKEDCEKEICSQYNFNCYEIVNSGQKLNDAQTSILAEASSTCKANGEMCIVSKCDEIKQSEGSVCESIVNQETEDEKKLKDKVDKAIKKFIDTYVNVGVDINDADQDQLCDILMGKDNKKGLYPYIKIVLNVTRIGGSVLVVILTGLDVMKVISSFKDDENKKFWNHLKIRLICLVVLILVPTIINFLLNLIIDSACKVEI